MEQAEDPLERQLRQRNDMLARSVDSDVPLTDGEVEASRRRVHMQGASRRRSGRSSRSSKGDQVGKPSLKYFTWGWFTASMATGGLANAIHSVPEPFRFHGLYAIGIVFMILNIIVFLVNCACMTLHAVYWPKDFRKSFVTPGESIFIPASVLSLATILITAAQYGCRQGKTGPWFVTTMIIFYWAYLGIAVCFSAGIYLMYWSRETFTLKSMTPQWIFPAYPLLLVGPYAGFIANPDIGAQGTMARNIIIGGVMVQGVGFMLSVMAYSSYLYRLMSQRLPPEAARPSMFISVGPCGFTVTALIHMGRWLPQVTGPDFMNPGNGDFAGRVSQILANWAGIWLWGLTLWFFITSVGAHYPVVVGNRFDIAPSFFALIFPNSALCTSTFAVAQALDNNHVIAIIGCVMTVILVVVWIFVVAFLIRGFVRGKLLLPPPTVDSDDSD